MPKLFPQPILPSPTTAHFFESYNPALLAAAN
jgi:hypothetical protein